MTTYIAIGPHCWGRGKTQAEAIRRARENWPSFLCARPLARNFSIWATPDDEAYVDDLGYIHANDAIKIQTSRLAA